MGIPEKIKETGYFCNLPYPRAEVQDNSCAVGVKNNQYTSEMEAGGVQEGISKRNKGTDRQPDGLA